MSSLLRRLTLAALTREGVQRESGSAVSAMARFAVMSVLGGALAMALLLVFLFGILNEQLTKNAREDVKQRTLLIGRTVIPEKLTQAVLAGDSRELNDFDKAIKDLVFYEGSPVVRVKIWNKDGKILYSDKHDLIGTRYDLGEEEKEALDNKSLECCETAPLDKPENVYEKDVLKPTVFDFLGPSRLFEVYLGTDSKDAGPVLYENYVREEALSAIALQTWLSVLPGFGLAALVLVVFTLPLAWLHGESQRKREALLEQLRESNAELGRASQAKSQFLASMSHELRTPMNAILGFTDALLAGVDGPLNGEQQQSLQWVQRSGRELINLINDVLDLSRIEAGKLVVSPERFPPRALVESVCGQLQLLAAEKGLRLAWRDEGAPDEVTLDPQRTRQILVNLIGNAVKFTVSGEVDVVLTGVDRKREIEVRVRDTGPGIARKDLENIFQEFGRAAISTNVQQGAGLGLATSRRLARAMGGDITVQSEPGQGSTFTVRLPVQLETAEEAVVTARRPGERLLLAVDDDPSFAPLLEKMLADTPYRVVAATRPSAAVRVARELRPDVITLDLLMPPPDGWKVLEDLRADAVTKRMPVVVVSVVDDPGPATLKEAADYIRKPLTKESLLGALERVERTPSASGP